VARFDYEATEAEDLGFVAGDVIRLKDRVGDEWLRGELNGKTGVFPVAFVEIIEHLPSPAAGEEFFCFRLITVSISTPSSVACFFSDAFTALSWQELNPCKLVYDPCGLDGSPVNCLRLQLGLVVSQPSPVNTGMGDHVQAGKSPRFVTSHSSQLSLLPSVGQKMSTSQSVVMLCSWGVKAAMVHSVCEQTWAAGKTVIPR